MSSLGLSAVVACSESNDGGATASAVAPGAPTIDAATPGDGEVTISFSAPTSDGGSTIINYTITCVSDADTQTGVGAGSPVTVDELLNGTTYECAVTATNSIGDSPSSTAVTVTPSGTANATTASVDCPFSGAFDGDYSAAGALTATWSWTCGVSTRTLSGNGLPDHAVGAFPNPGNPNTISEQIVSANMPLAPELDTVTTQIGGPGGVNVYARNSVKFDPATAGTCPSRADEASDCDLAMGFDQWRIEALGQDVFDFGEDMNNAHVQPTGEYHYHGMPEGMLTNAGVSDVSPGVVHVGWAADGFPVYARYCFSDPLDASSAIKVCEGSYTLDTAVDVGRPDVSWAPLGVFASDWNYTEGSGDLDECNGRFGVTPEFPDGIYYYMATDDYPYFSRCLKGRL